MRLTLSITNSIFTPVWQVCYCFSQKESVDPTSLSHSLPSTISLDTFLEAESSSPSAPEYSPVTVFETITSSSAESVHESGHDSSNSGSPVMADTKSCSLMFERGASGQLTRQVNNPTCLLHGMALKQ